MLKKLQNVFSAFNLPKKEKLFQWEGLSSSGLRQYGCLFAENRHQAIQMLRGRSILVKKIFTPWKQTLSHQDLIQFLQHMVQFLRTGLSVVQILTLLSSYQTKNNMLAFVMQLQHHLASGSGFAAALQKYSKSFDPMTCAFIQLGERSGQLIAILDQIAQQKIKNHLLKQRLQNLLIYPGIVISIACSVSFFVIWIVVPQMQTLFLNMHQNLPLSTKLLLSWTQVIKKNGLFIFIFTTCCLLGLVFSYRKLPAIQKRLDGFLLKIPLIGKLCQEIFLARAFLALSISSEASFPLIDALQWTAYTIGNQHYKQAFLHIRSALMRGDSLRCAIYETKLFPPMVLQFLSLGEQSGTLQTIFSDLSAIYIQKTEHSIKLLSTCLEPFLMLILGIGIGFLILALYSPIMQMGALM